MANEARELVDARGLADTAATLRREARALQRHVDRLIKLAEQHEAKRPEVTDDDVEGELIQRLTLAGEL